METILTEEDIYNFDTAGWLHLPAVLTVSEQRAATAAVEAAGDDEAALGAVARGLLADDSTILAHFGRAVVV